MNFKLNLNEDLFDDDMSLDVETELPEVLFDLDDDFVDYEEHSTENTLPGPAEGTDTGVASELIALINDEWEAIQGYNNAIATLRANANQNPFYLDAVKVLEEISGEENTHVGQLQELLKQVSPNAAEIQKGTKEAKSQLGLVGGLLPVESWDSVKSAHNSSSNEQNVNSVDETCTLCDVDDEM